MADLICFQLTDGVYKAVLLEKVNLTYENRYYVFFDITKYTFNFKREILHTAHGQVKTLHAGSDDNDLDVHNCEQVLDFFASVVYIEEHNNNHVGGIDDREYRAWNSDTESTEILLPTESSAQLALQSECVLNTSKFDDHAYMSVRRSEWNELQAGRNRQMELEEDVSDLQVQVNELSRKLNTYEAEYEITVKELHHSQEKNSFFNRQNEELEQLCKNLRNQRSLFKRQNEELQHDYKELNSKYNKVYVDHLLLKETHDEVTKQLHLLRGQYSELKAQLSKTAQTQGTQTTQNQYRVDQIFIDTI